MVAALKTINRETECILLPQEIIIASDPSQLCYGIMELEILQCLVRDPVRV
jgi:hypothetical protein